MNAVEVSSLGKKFTRRKDSHRTFKSFVLGTIGRSGKGEEFWALKNVSFEVKQGETLGIIGANGAGKSTLLSLIAQTTCPTEGMVCVHGKMSTLLELGAGFHPDLTGRENVFLNASILGMSRRETEDKYEEIVELAGIRPSIDSPVKFYSSGMYVRLGFAVAVMCNPDVLLMDEILAVGDEMFRKKSLERVERFKNEGKTLLIVSHDLETVKRLADRVLLLNEGSIVDLGTPLEVVDHYRNFGIYQDGHVTVKEYGTREIIIKDVRFKTGGAEIKGDLMAGRELTIEMTLQSKTKVKNPVVGFGISDNLGTIVFGTNTQIQHFSLPEVNGEQPIRIHLPALNLQRGTYYFSVAVHHEDHHIQYHRLDNAFKLKISHPDLSEGFLFQPCTFELS
ncbi:MAG: ABC transporter ATP-binding protein [Candidatus Aureabacteria bacterium]|nr:ABC transporter ATP-binding protein [Candidatus Auribacterota bacterium]